MTESIIQPEPFPKGFCMLDIIVVWIYWKTSTMSRPLNTTSGFELEQKLSNFVLSLLSIFLNTKTNVVTNLKPFNWVNKSISFFLIADSLSLSCSSGWKKFKMPTLKVLPKPLQVCSRFVIFTFFSFKKFSFFFVSLYKELSESTFSAYLIVLDNLCEDFGCSVIIDFIWTVSKVFRW